LFYHYQAMSDAQSRSQIKVPEAGPYRQPQVMIEIPGRTPRTLLGKHVA
jgi:hypothetical protein